MQTIKHFVKIALVAMTVLLVACGGQGMSEPTSIELATEMPVPPTETPTPSPVPTNTPTLTPTPMGGRSGLLLAGDKCQNNTAYYTVDCKIYTYDISSQKTNLLLEGYSPIGVSPDGKIVAVQKFENEKTDLFIVDLAKPEQIVLLYENVMEYESVWFPGTEWIGFIAKNDGKRQVFIIHPDGSDLTQVTNSSIGTVTLEPVFSDGVFWGEGWVDGNGTRHVEKYKWTKLDGTETVYINFNAVTPSGKFVIASSMNLNPSCMFCNVELIDVATSEKKEVTLPTSGRVLPLSDDKWLVDAQTYNPEYYVVSSDGTISLNFADLPHHHDPLPENAEKVDNYSIIGQSREQHLSPDGNLLVIEHFIVFTKKPLNYEVSYYVLNLSTLEIQELPGLLFTSKNGTVANNGRFIDGVTDGFSIDQFFWIEMP